MTMGPQGPINGTTVAQSVFLIQCDRMGLTSEISVFQLIQWAMVFFPPSEGQWAMVLLPLGKGLLNNGLLYCFP